MTMAALRQAETWPWSTNLASSREVTIQTGSNSGYSDAKA